MSKSHLRPIESSFGGDRRPHERLSFARLLAFRSRILFGSQFFCLRWFARFFLPHGDGVRSPDRGFDCHFAKNRSLLAPRAVLAKHRSPKVSSDRRRDLRSDDRRPLLACN